jgi:MFS family permease
MNAFAAIVFASLLSRLGYQMARSPVLPAFAASLGALPEFIGVIVAASTITGIFFKLPSGALSDVLGRKRMMVLGGLFFALPPFLYPFVAIRGCCSRSALSTALRPRSFRRSPPLTSRALPRPGAARASAGSPRVSPRQPDGPQ